MEMSLKLKALGLSLVAAMAVSAFAVMSASANEKGHFVSDVAHTVLKGTEGPGGAHRLHLTNHKGEGPLGCDEASYTATTTTATVTSLTVSPSYAKCYTTPGAPGWTPENDIPVTVNGCTYTFTVAEKTVNTTEQTVHLLCPAGKKIEVHHPNCTVDIHPQTIVPEANKPTVTYTDIENPITKKREITLDANVTFSITRHGLCQFVLPTNDFGKLIGSATFSGFDTENKQVNITAT
jgi:hypothetical protein